MEGEGCEREKGCESGCERVCTGKPHRWCPCLRQADRGRRERERAGALSLPPAGRAARGGSALPSSLLRGAPFLRLDRGAHHRALPPTGASRGGAFQMRGSGEVNAPAAAGPDAGTGADVSHPHLGCPAPVSLKRVGGDAASPPPRAGRAPRIAGPLSTQEWDQGGPEGPRKGPGRHKRGAAWRAPTPLSLSLNPPHQNSRSLARLSSLLTARRRRRPPA